MQDEDLARLDFAPRLADRPPIRIADLAGSDCVGEAGSGEARGNLCPISRGEGERFIEALAAAFRRDPEGNGLR